MEVSPFLPLCKGLVVERVEHTATTLTIAVTSTSLVAACPQCQEPSEHLHGHYQRTMADLPCSGRQVTLHLKVRKFVCLNLACPQVIFAERFDAFVQPRARQTSRLQESLRTLGFATSGETAARLAPQFGLSGSPSTILRQIKATVGPPAAPATKVGLDDFAFRRGLRYGTIIVDLETHRVLDLLPDRTVATVATWLKDRPWIELISRDRGADYAAAAQEGAPQAVQVADRWHLIHNLSEYLCLLLERYRAELRALSLVLLPPVSSKREKLGVESESPVAPAGDALPLPVASGPPYRTPWIQATQQARRTQRLDRYQRVVELCQAGLTQIQIAQQVGVCTRTLRRWLAQESVPEQRQRRRRPSLVDPYEAYVLRRWQAGCRNGLQLWREVRAQGYPGSYKAFYSFLNRLQPADAGTREGVLQAKQRRAKPASPPTGPTDSRLARRAVWLWLRPQVNLSSAEQEALLALRQAHPDLDQAYQLTSAFVTMLQQHQADCLPHWIKRARGSHLPELVTFGRGLKRDEAAVQAGLALPYSQGVVEGQVNRLKLIKRMMYGRAGFPLLRQRLLQSA